MKTYEQERERFLSANEDMIEEYNCMTGTWLMEDLDNTWRSLHASNSRLNPGSFFREARAILRNTRDGYDGVDIPDLLLHSLQGARLAAVLLRRREEVLRGPPRRGA